LLRSEECNNPGTWGLPGGNVEEIDGPDPLRTAERESTEELGHLPSEYKIVGNFVVRRGKYMQKAFTIYIAIVPPEIKEAYRPQLNKEHRHWSWFELSCLPLTQDIHPWVGTLLYKHKKEVLQLLSPEAEKL